MATVFPFSLQNWHRATTYIPKVFSRFILLAANFFLRCISVPSISKCRDLHYLGDRCALDVLARANESFDEREYRLSEVRVNTANRRESEISPVREMRLLQQRIETISQIQRESSFERLQQLNNQRGRSICNREVTVSRAAFQYQPHVDYINSIIAVPRNGKRKRLVCAVLEVKLV